MLLANYKREQLEADEQRSKGSKSQEKHNGNQSDLRITGSNE